MTDNKNYDNFIKKLPTARPIKMLDSTFLELGVIKADLSKKDGEVYSMEKTLLHLISLYNAKKDGIYVNL